MPKKKNLDVPREIKENSSCELLSGSCLELSNKVVPGQVINAIQE